MSLLLAPEMVEPVTRGLLGAIDVDGGPTDEQLAVLGAIVTHVWGRDDLDLRALRVLDPQATAATIVDAEGRQRFKELMVTLELCRHPESANQVRRVEVYAEALGVGGPALTITRDWIDEGTKRATEDFDRFYAQSLGTLSEPSLRDEYLRIEFVCNLTIHEAGLVQHAEIAPKTSTLQRAGATDLLAEALWRGSQCTSDFSQTDHLMLADQPLAEVRAHFGVPAGPSVSG